MTSPLHVLVYGPFDTGVCDTYRFGMHREALAMRGIEIRGFNKFHLSVMRTRGAVDLDLDAAFASDSAVLDRSDIDWADVIVFRRFYVTRWSCAGCVLGSPRKADLVRHRALTGHEFSEPDRLVRRIFSVFDDQPELLRGRAIVYETDDDLLSTTAWNGIGQRIAPERALIERMLRRADLVTVATPILAERHRPYNDEIRIVRNAVDPSWYAGASLGEPPTGDPRVLYYGSPVRMRDYEVCRPAVDELVRRFPAARRVWLGALDAPGAGGLPDPVIAAVDEVGPYVEGPAAFARILAAAKPDVGLAPLVGDGYDQAKSELHWLEYTMAGAATIATRLPGGGPYDVIRDGVDGLLAGDRDEWLAALTRLASSRALREDLAGRARERVMAEYTVQVRAEEWADAYRWAAEHAGRGVAGRVHGLGELTAGSLEDEAQASLAHRRRAREDAVTAPGRLATLRGTRVVCWPEQDATDPLVSVIIPVVDEPIDLLERAVRSAVAGSHTALEIVVAVGGAQADLIAGVEAVDRRVHVVRVAEPARVPPGATAARVLQTSRLLDAALAASVGAWIAPLGPEAEFSLDHIELLLSVAVEHQLEFVYGQAVFELASAKPITLCAWPPNADGVLTIGSELFSRRLGDIVRFDAEAWREGESAGWAFWRTVIEAGARIASVDADVTHLRLGEHAGRPGDRQIGEGGAITRANDPATPSLDRRAARRRFRGAVATRTSASTADTSHGRVNVRGRRCT